jgi:MFS family permease
LGAFLTILPVFSTNVLNGGSELYGLLLGALAVGEVLSSVLAGTLDLPYALGKLIALAQFTSGLMLGLLLLGFNIPLAIISMALLGFCSAPLTIWAQTLRMKIIPAALRGRTFALLRMLMQSTNPAGGMVGGFLLPLLSFPVMIGLAASVIAIAGFIGLQVRPLREAK